MDRRKYLKEYQRKKKNISRTIYHSQTKHSQDRGHSYPTYSMKELNDWLYSQSLFHKLYDNWKRLDFQSEYKPSVDRKDNSVGYTMDNIQLTTWGNNRSKEQTNKKLGINKKHNKEVWQYATAGTFLEKYHSVNEAERKTNIHQGSISKVCNDKRKLAGGFIWRYKNDLL